MSRRASTTVMDHNEIQSVTNDLFALINSSKWSEGREFLKNKTKLIPKELKIALSEIIDSEEMYCTEMDKSLIPETTRFNISLRRKKDLESHYRQVNNVLKILIKNKEKTKNGFMVIEYIIGLFKFDRLNLID
jgi:hypothetical protein